MWEINCFDDYYFEASYIALWDEEDPVLDEEEVNK